MSQRQDKPRLSFLWQGVPAQECQANFPNGMVCRWNLRPKAEPGYTLPSSNYCIPIRAGEAVAPAAQMGAIFSVHPPPAGGAGALWGGRFLWAPRVGMGAKVAFTIHRVMEPSGRWGCVCGAGRKAHEIAGRCSLSFSLLNSPWFKITWTLLGTSHRRENLERAF